MPHHAHSIDRWDDATGSNLYEHLAGVNDLLLARATFAAAVKRWPGAKITLRNGARIIEKTWPADAQLARAILTLRPGNPKPLAAGAPGALTA
jgi:hypothetical protein